MNREKIKALLPVLTAFSEGKIIQTQGVGTHRGKWFDNQNPNFDLPADHYRVKPEPREFGIILRKDGTVVRAVQTAALNVEVAHYNVHGARQSMPYTGIIVVEQL